MRILIFFILLFGLAFQVLVAQPYTSEPRGYFTIDQTKGCAPFTVTLNAPSCDGSIGCDVDYTGGNTFKSILGSDSFTYTQPGTYTIRLVRGVEIDNIQVQVFPNIAPAIELLACGNNGVIVRVTDTSYDQYIIDYGDGTPEVVVPVSSPVNQHSYTTPGNKTITVRGRNQDASDNCARTTRTINVVEELAPPVITRLEVINTSQIRLNISGQPDTRYRLEITQNNNSTFQQIKTISNKSVDTISNLSPDNNFYCFRIAVYDPCNTSAPPTYSNTICSTNTDLAVLNNEIQLAWATASLPSITNRVVVRTNGNQSFSRTTTFSPYSDTNLTCGTEYCYRLVVNYGSGIQSFSLPKCGVAISDDIPATVTDISAIVGEQGINLQWLPTGYPPKEFSLFRSSQGTNNLLKTTREFGTTDEEYTPESGYCYRVSYVDVCDNQSELSIEACPVVLTGNLESDNTVNLSWTDYTGWQNGVSNYVVDKYNERGQLLGSFDAGISLSYLDDTEDLTTQVYVYVIRAIPTDGSVTPSVSNRITVIKNPNLFYPTSFTPNDDALNDIFNVFGQYITDFQMDIFNRWGELMFTTSNLSEGWDGKYKGNPMPEGTYTFVANITDLAGRNFKRSGTVVLLRKK